MKPLWGCCAGQQNGTAATAGIEHVLSVARGQGGEQAAHDRKRRIVRAPAVLLAFGQQALIDRPEHVVLVPGHIQMAEGPVQLMAGRPEKPVVFVQHAGHMPLVQKALPVQHMPPQGQQGLTSFQTLFLDETYKGLYGRDVLPVDKVSDRKNPSPGLPLVRTRCQLPGRLCCQTRPVAPCCRGNQCGWLIPGHVSSPAAGPGRPLAPIASRKPCAGMRTGLQAPAPLCSQYALPVSGRRSVLCLKSFCLPADLCVPAPCPYRPLPRDHEGARYVAAWYANAPCASRLRPGLVPVIPGPCARRHVMRPVLVSRPSRSRILRLQALTPLMRLSPCPDSASPRPCDLTSPRPGTGIGASLLALNGSQPLGPSPS